MLQPQSDEEVRLVVEALRRLDPLLDVRWNPQAKLLRGGRYDVRGGQFSPPEYDGRWEVIRHNTAGLHDRNYVVICQVTQPVRYGKRQVWMMEHDGAYAPVGDWLVEYMQTCDAAQVHFADKMRELAENDEKAMSLKDEIDGNGAHQEALEKIYAEFGDGPYWMGRGFGKGRRSSDRTTPATTPATSGSTA